MLSGVASAPRSGPEKTQRRKPSSLFCSSRVNRRAGGERGRRHHLLIQGDAVTDAALIFGTPAMI
ncbi:MAG: hypothetical protein AVDCRST_MAG39-453 [uncultured Sphingomonadaceae bacterium]|uniref:Uncharacterized protein n=1 Tax=uncultured Sphingomonadaceae bacterium TaxID=169976 RepID=A0A6J4S044_9SPHN|nr:MAG: hypothetical protein AVDCRST_MAG39-453 [uncultured Sphingomonadaceae bacterium]